MALPEKVYVRDHRRLGDRLGASIPRSAFAGATLDRLYTGDGIDALAEDAHERVIRFNRDLLTCGCDAMPYCGHPEEAFCRWVLDERLGGASPEEIVDLMGERYHVYAYPGDVLTFLDDAIRRLDAIADLAAVEGTGNAAERARAVRRHLETGAHPSR